MAKKSEIIVISLGGSLINPRAINIDFLKQFKKVVLDIVKKGNRIVIVTGGGQLARDYNNAAKLLNKRISEKELDWMGIRATKTNAELIRSMFTKDVYYKVVDTPTEKLDKFRNSKIIVAGGWKPGASSDNMAVHLAKQYKATKLVNLTNVDYVYTKDPVKYKEALQLKRVTWKEFRKIVGLKWVPGKHVPFDPIASKTAQNIKLEVAILSGKNLANLRYYLQGKKFIGTVVK